MRLKGCLLVDLGDVVKWRSGNHGGGKSESSEDDLELHFGYSISDL